MHYDSGLYLLFVHQCHHGERLVPLGEPMPLQLRASLAFISMPSDDPGTSRSFYEDLFGIEMARSLSKEESYHAPISADGIDFNVGVRHTPQESATPFVAVEDLQAVLQRVNDMGGRVVWGPEDLPLPEEDRDDYAKAVHQVEGLNVWNPSMGRAAIILDPGGSALGLVQLAEHAQRHFAVGRFQKPLDDHQVEVHRTAMRLSARRDRARYP